jgi:hypothetical protein
MSLNWIELQEFNEFLKRVETVHRADVDNLSGADKGLLARVTERFPRVERNAFIASLPTQDRLITDLAATKRYLLLRPVEKGVKLQPVVTFAMDLSCQKIPIPKISVYVALGFLVGSGIRYLGYRFETPEGPPSPVEGTDPRHAFFHAQPIRAFERGNIRLNDPESDLGAVPEDQPSFVLVASDFVSFGLSVFTALYGGHFLTESSNQEMVSKKRLEEFRNLMAFDPNCSISRAIKANKKTKKKK